MKARIGLSRNTNILGLLWEAGHTGFVPINNYKARVSPAANMDAWDRAYSVPLPRPTTHEYILAGGLGGGEGW